MPSLWYYMLVDQYSTTVELFSRIDDTQEWINSVYEDMADAIVLPRLSVEMTLGAIYDSIDLIPTADEIDPEERP